MEKSSTFRPKKILRRTAVASTSVATTRGDGAESSSTKVLRPVIHSPWSEASSWKIALPAAIPWPALPPPKVRGTPSLGSKSVSGPVVAPSQDIHIATAFPRFVELPSKLQTRIIQFAWAALRQPNQHNEVHPCDFELGRMGVVCPSAPSFDDFRRSFKRSKLLPLVEQVIFHRSTLLVRVELARDSYSTLPVGYIPSVLVTLNQEPILKKNVGALVLDISCAKGGKVPRVDALQQPFPDRSEEDQGSNRHNASRRRDEIDLLTSLIVHGFPNRNHLYVKLKVDFMSYEDLLHIFKIFSSTDGKFTLKETCTIHGSPTTWPRWSTIQEFNEAYSPISTNAARNAGQNWLIHTIPTQSLEWRPWAERRVEGETLWSRTAVWEGVAMDKPGELSFNYE